MRSFSLAEVFASIAIFASLSLCATPRLSGPSLQQSNGAPLHVPICEAQAGRFDLYVCAALLVRLKNLPYYQQREIWSEYIKGDGHLPATFSLSDRSRQRQCFLTMDLYEPGVPVTAKETFSLAEEQHEFNNIYFECLKAKGISGFIRIGFLGNVAAFLGPRLNLDNPLLANFKNLGANNGSEINNFRVIEMADLAER